MPLKEISSLYAEVEADGRLRLNDGVLEFLAAQRGARLVLMAREGRLVVDVTPGTTPPDSGPRSDSTRTDTPTD